jgi:hypothetical protein
MRKQWLVFCCVALLAVPATAQTFTAVMTGAEEVPAGDPDGTGVALVRIDGTSVHYSVVTQNIDTATAAHIHRGPAGVAGNVVIPFNVSTLTGGTATGLDPALLDEIRTNPGNFYVNVHNPAFPGGAVRGQLVPLGATASRGAQFFPVVGKVGGAAGTNFVTDVRIINRGTTDATVTLDFFQQSATAHTSPTSSRIITVAPGEQRVINDVIGFLGTSGLGGLRVSSTGTVDVLARVINDLRATNEGTAGFAVSSRALADATTSGTLGFLTTSSAADINARIGFRTNIGYFNPTDRTVTATFTARRSEDGSVIGSRTITIPAFGFAQQGAFDLISEVAPGDLAQENFYVTWTSTGGPLFVYAAIVDNRTGDSVMVQ